MAFGWGASSHMASHYTRESVTTPHDLLEVYWTTFWDFHLGSHNSMVTALDSCVKWPYMNLYQPDCRIRRAPQSKWHNLARSGWLVVGRHLIPSLLLSMDMHENPNVAVYWLVKLRWLALGSRPSTGFGAQRPRSAASHPKGISLSWKLRSLRATSHTSHSRDRGIGRAQKKVSVPRPSQRTSKIM